MTEIKNKISKGQLQYLLSEEGQNVLECWPLRPNLAKCQFNRHEFDIKPIVLSFQDIRIQEVSQLAKACIACPVMVYAIANIPPTLA